MHDWCAILGGVLQGSAQLPALHTILVKDITDYIVKLYQFVNSITYKFSHIIQYRTIVKTSKIICNSIYRGQLRDSTHQFLGLSVQFEKFSLYPLYIPQTKLLDKWLNGKNSLFM
jgi:hypothetical protein